MIDWPYFDDVATHRIILQCEELWFRTDCSQLNVLGVFGLCCVVLSGISSIEFWLVVHDHLLD